MAAGTVVKEVMSVPLADENTLAALDAATPDETVRSSVEKSLTPETLPQARSLARWKSAPATSRLASGRSTPRCW
ncbi:hypothetical protein [Verrucomicrobium spinosum]|uniref:hypothetical protein n=1 Tax=Verrucomicrobium spinosum TaxID=2736 RepID=UPI001C443E67|nr:hypothetical protein [Verrucomicrobium spinosum]